MFEDSMIKHMESFCLVFILDYDNNPIYIGDPQTEKDTLLILRYLNQKVLSLSDLTEDEVRIIEKFIRDVGLQMILGIIERRS